MSKKAEHSFRLILTAATISELQQKLREVATQEGVFNNTVTVEADDDDDNDNDVEISPSDEFEPPVPQSAPAGIPTFDPSGVGSVTGRDQNSVERDAAGMPWDPRIHSGNKTKTKKGLWQKRKGVDQATIAQVEAELKGNAQAPQQESTPIAPPALTPNVVPLQQTATPAPVASSVPASSPTPQTPPAVPPAPLDPKSHTFETFRMTDNFIRTVNVLLAEKKIDQDYMASLCQHFQVQNLWDICHDEAKARACFDLFVQYGLINKVG